MKLRLLIIGLLASAACFAQGPTTSTYGKIEQSSNWMQMYLRRLHVPASDDTTRPAGQWPGAGRMMLDTTGSNVGFYIQLNNKMMKLAWADSVSGSGGGLSGGNLGSGYRVYYPPTSGVKTLYGDITGRWDSTTNSNGLTYKADTLLLSTRAWRQKGIDSLNAVKLSISDTSNMLLNYVRRKELIDTAAAIRSSIGTGGGTTATAGPGLRDSLGALKIDNRRDLVYVAQPTTGSAITADWSAVGTPTYTVSNGKFVFTGAGTGGYGQIIRSNKGTLMEWSSVEAYVIYNTLTGTDAGVEIGWQSYNAFGYPHSMRGGWVSDASSGNYGKAILSGSYGPYASYSDSSRVAAAGDTLFYKLQRWGLQYKILVRNITKGWQVQKIVQANPNGVPFVANNSAYPSVYIKGGAFTVYGFKYTINAPVVTDIIFLGNSITTRQAANTESSGWVSRVGIPSMNMGSGGGADVSAYMLARVPEIIAVRPRRVVVFDPAGNDILFGVATATWKANITAIRDSLVNNGIEVIWAFSPRTATDVSAQKIWVDTSSTFRSDLKAPVWDALVGVGTALKTEFDADGTHPNDRAQSPIASVMNETLHFQNGTTFHVNGNLAALNGSVTGTTSGAPGTGLTGAFLVNGASGTGYGMMGYDVTSDYLWLQGIKPAVGYKNIVMNLAGGNVGIGVDPTSMLHLKNATAPAITLERTGTGSWILGNTPQTTNTDFRLRWGAFDWLSVNTLGKFGINNTAPLSTFDITGAFRVSDTAKLNAQVYQPNNAYTASANVKMLVIDTVDGKYYHQVIPSGGGGGGSVTDVTGGYGIISSPTTGNVIVKADTTVGIGVVTWPRLNKKIDSLAAVSGTGSDVNNQFGGPQNARAWVAGTLRSDSTIYGRTTGAMNAAAAAGIISYGSSGTNNQMAMGYDNTLNAGWFQAVTAGTAYRDIIAQSAGGRFGVGAHTALPASLLHLKQSYFPAIRLEKTGVSYWTIGRRLEDNTSTFNISYGTTDHINVLASGEMGLGTAAPEEVLHVNGQVKISSIAGAAVASMDSILVMEAGRIKALATPASTWTPTASAAAGGTVGSVGVFTYSRQGNIVTISGKVAITHTSGSSLMSFELSLPSGHTSNFASDENANGTVGTIVTGSDGFFEAEPTNDTIKVTVYGGPTANAGMGIRVTGQYRIL